MASEINGLPPSAPALPGAGEHGPLKPAAGRSEPDAEPARTGRADTDTVSLTGAAARLRALEARLAQLPDTDVRRVEAIRQAVAEGSYRVDPERVAERLLAFESMLGIRTKK